MNDDRPFTIIGHRGARGHAPENTLLALDTGIRLGAHWLEFDVQLAASVLWLMHDLSVDRTTNGRGLLADKDATRFRRFDAGQDLREPTTRDAAELVENRLPVIIERKSWDGCSQAIAAALLDYVSESWTAERVLVPL